MNFHRFRRSLTMALALVLVLSLVPVSAMAAESDGLCEHHTAHDEACGYAPAVEAKACTHACTESPECFETKCAHVHEITCYNTDGDLSCRHVCTDSPACSEAVHNCVHEHDGECGYAEAQEEVPCTYAVNGCPECKAEEERPTFTLIELVATDVTLDETEFTYTGEEIRPNVTVRVKGELLTLGKDYTLEYADNIEPGTAKVIVTGIATASETVGYTGTVEHPFTIAPAQEPEQPEEPETPEEYPLVEIKGTDVIIDGTEFAYTGEAIEPAVTVTVEGQILTAGKDYSVKYLNNIEPGTATVVINGIATATENGGYTGEVRIDFTITPAQEPEQPETPETSEPTEPSEPETPDQPEPPEEPETPETSEPTEPSQPSEPTEPSEPEASDPTEPSVPEESEPEKATYKITKGSGASWYRATNKALSFTADGKFADFKGVSVDGKELNEKYYLVKEDTMVSLTSIFLEKLSLGKHTITIHFADGDAEGTFTVANPTDDSNPKTGDAFNLHLWSAVLFMSLTALAGIAFVYVRKLRK